MLLFAQNEETQEEHKVHGTIKIAPFDFVANTLTLGVEQKIAPKVSVQLYGSIIMNKNGGGNNYDKYALNSIGGAGELQIKRFLLNKRTPLDGLYAGLFAKYLYLENTRTPNDNYIGNINYYPSTPSTPDPLALEPKLILNQYSGGFLVGYQVIIAKLVALDFYGGGGIKISEANYSDNSLDFIENNTTMSLFYRNYSGIFPKFGIKAGITF